MSERVANLVASGPLLAALVAAGLAGVLSVLSPCVLPLVPGYLSYVTGLAVTDLAFGGAGTGRGAGTDGAGTDGAGPDSARTDTGTGPATLVRSRRRVLAGSALFVAGFATVFISASVVAAGAARVLLTNRRLVEIVAGCAIVGFGLALLGLVPRVPERLRPWRLRTVRVGTARVGTLPPRRRLPAAGLAGAPLFGAVFALSWTPCVGPVLGAVLALAAAGGSTARAVAMAVAYCFGLGLPFVAIGLGLNRALRVVAVVRRNGAVVTRFGGVLLLVTGLALVTGVWSDFVRWLLVTLGQGAAPL